ncbi:Zinc-transporting ATPase [Poriferisphaera corsica]|uniref:P-type Zn(2+) transporter n=1 Tax=Poriferisphaera corsica TaxID=2528020 RepID=A0A517YPT5_9BACT|nr:heavy metal translocating P-type ATPase [Poriferisphaera corsica]QDU32244.1 Zinc-transporting ATPase [Poriferisphaera corsica]
MHTVSLTVQDCTPGQSNQCQGCISQRLDLQPGVTSYRFTNQNDALSVAVTYDPRVLTLAELARQLRCSHAHLDPNIAQMVIKLKGMHNPRCERTIESTINALSGVYATASYPSSSLRLEFDRLQCPLPEIIRRLDLLGYSPVFPAPVDLHTTSQSLGITQKQVEQLPKQTEKYTANKQSNIWNWLRTHPDILLVSISALSFLIGFLIFVLGGSDVWRITFLAIAAITASTQTAPEAVQSIRQFKLDVDVLMFVAATGAASLGHYEEGAFLLFLFGLGAAGEHLALSRARSAINALSTVTPDTADLIHSDGSITTVPVSNLKIGDQVLVKPYARIPSDGEILQGASEVDQATITGEAQPVAKHIGDSVFAGTMNTTNALTLNITKTASESTIARILKLVEEAQTTKSKTQLFTDRIEAVYVPIVFLATILLVVLVPLLTTKSWGLSFLHAMAFLTAASPCALAIGTPAAILCAIARSAKIGVLIKGGIHLEQLAHIKAIAFDKTGTLTTGQPQLLDIVMADQDNEPTELLKLAASVESSISHPLAQAIKRAAEQKKIQLESVLELTQTAGQGASALVKGQRITVGKLPTGIDLSEDLNEHANQLEQQGLTVIYITRNQNHVLGFLSLQDTLRSNAQRTIQQLNDIGITHTSLLTGDHVEAATRLNSLGLSNIHADLLPEDKLNLIDELTKQYKHVAMVGDGVNDAPALAHASIGIAMGAAGSDVALETADIVLPGSNLSRIPNAIQLARRSRKIIIQNLVFALAVIAIVSPLAAIGFANLAVAVFLHEGSTVLVTLNALRLLRFNPDPLPAIDSPHQPAIEQPTLVNA